VNASQKFQTPKTHHPREKQQKKKKAKMTSNFSSLQTGYHKKFRDQSNKNCIKHQTPQFKKFISSSGSSSGFGSLV
jgi:hypothetical protein